MPKTRQPLSRKLIVDTALAIVDADGLEALSMRRLGAELGVNPMATYYHLPNKAALLDVVVEAVMTEIDLGVDDPSKPAEERLVVAAKAYAEVLFRHGNTLPVLFSRGPTTAAALAPVELLVAILRDGGLSLEHAMAGMHLVTAAVRGFAAILATRMADPGHRDAEGSVALSSPEDFPHLSQAAAQSQQDPHEQFEFGLRALARGLLGTGSARPPSASAAGRA